MTPGPPAPWPTRPAPRPRPGLPWLAFPARTPRPAHSWAEPVIVAVQRWREARKLGDDHRRPDGHQRTSAMITGPDGRQSRQPRCPGASRRVRWPAQPTKRRVIPTDPPPRARAGTRRRNPSPANPHLSSPPRPPSREPRPTHRSRTTRPPHRPTQNAHRTGATGGHAPLAGRRQPPPTGRDRLATTRHFRSAADRGGGRP